MYLDMVKLHIGIKSKVKDFLYNLGADLSRLNMFLTPINISSFHFGSSKIFLKLLVSIKFLITTFDPYF